jgi:lipoprotein LprG
MLVRAVWKRGAVVAALGALVLLVVGCGEPEQLTPQQVIEKAVPAIQEANSFHFTYEASKPDKPLPGIFIVSVEGDAAKPDKLVADVTGTASGINVNIKVAADGDKQYMTDPISGRWGTMSPVFNVTQFFDPAKGVSDILAGVKELTSDGTETIDGTAAYRLKGTVPAAALKSLSPEVTATEDLPSTLWIGSGDFLLRRVKLDGPILSGEPADLTRTISLSEFNKEVVVQTPEVK